MTILAFSLSARDTSLASTSFRFSKSCLSIRTSIEFLLLKALDDVESAPSPHSSRGIRTVCNVLKFLQNKLGNHQHAAQESRFPLYPRFVRQ